MKFPKDGNWGLKLLSLVLAIVIYHALKNESNNGGRHDDRKFFHAR